VRRQLATDGVSTAEEEEDMSVSRVSILKLLFTGSKEDDGDGGGRGREKMR
jgi:hypothetical protein